MGKTLELDKEFEYVECPVCSHRWFARATYRAVAAETIYCSSCRAPLKQPVKSLLESTKEPSNETL